MEYRRRRKSRRSRRKTGIGVLVPILLLLAAVYLVSVSAAGSWMSKHIVEPVVTVFKAKENKPIENSSENIPVSVSKSGRLELPGIECYLLQIGVFTDEKRAEEAADEIRKQGGAGYIREEGGRYRVFAAGYSDEQDAREIKQKLLDSGTDCSVHKLQGVGTFDVEVTAGTDSTVAELQSVLYALLSAHDDLSELAKNYDEGSISKAQAAKAAEEIYNQFCDGTKETDGLPNIVREAAEECKASILDISKSGNLSDAEFSSKLKYAQIQLACKFADTVESLME